MPACQAAVVHPFLAPAVHGPGLLTWQLAAAGNKLFQTEFIQILTPGVSDVALTAALWQQQHTCGNLRGSQAVTGR